MVFYLLAAITVPRLGLAGLAGLLAASTVAFHTIEMPWYVGHFAMYHAEFLAGVLAFMARGSLARLGFWLPFAVGSASLYYFIAVWGGRFYVPIALFFLIAGFANIRDQSRWLTAIGAIGDASYSIYLLHPLVFLVACAITSKVAFPVWSEEPIRAACFVAILAMAFASWRYFEKPMITLGNRLAGRRIGRLRAQAALADGLHDERPAAARVAGG
jgi:peptidoglycan/LPS O-acetylase OafA/YrhL